MLCLVVGVLLLVLVFVGGYVVVVCKMVMLIVDGIVMWVIMMKLWVIDIVEENGFLVDDCDDLYFVVGVQVYDVDIIVLWCSCLLQILLDGYDVKQVWMIVLMVDEVLV